MSRIKRQLHADMHNGADRDQTQVVSLASQATRSGTVMPGDKIGR